MITKTNLPTTVIKIADALEQAGFEAYLVGGCVRDLLQSEEPKDWDFTTNAKPEEIIGLFEETYCNNDYGTVGVVTEEPEDSPGHIIEVTPYRSESGYSDARRPDKVEFGVSLEADLGRRDFTINAIAYRIKNKQLVDIFGGQNDLAKKLIRTVGRPDERFLEDALRMLRAIRFTAQLGFSIEAETTTSIDKNSRKLELISVERIRDEWLKIINSPRAIQGMVFLEKLGLIDYILPEIKAAIGCEQGGAHSHDVYEHLLHTMQAAVDKGYSTKMRLTALLHDIGKPATRRTGGKNKTYTFYGHEVVGARMTKKILNRLKVSRETSQIVEKLVRWHMFFADTEQVTLAAVRRTINRVGKDQIDNLLNLRVCDRIGTGRPKEQPFRFRKYKAMVDEALRDPISVKMLKIDGDKIMTITKERPGKRLGYMLHTLLEEVLDDPTKNTTAQLEERVKELANLPEAELAKLGQKGKEKQLEDETAELREIKKKHHVLEDRPKT